MSGEESAGGLPLDAHPNTRQLIDSWAEGLAQVLETMTDQRPQVSWQAVHGTAAEAGAGPETESLWWEQHFQFSREAVVWISAPRSTWEHAGNLTLKAAGLEEAPEGEARKTWLEILSQWFSGLARSIGSIVGREVLCGEGSEQTPPDEACEWAVFALAFGDTALPALAAAFSAPLLTLLTAPPEPAPEAPAAVAAEAETAPPSSLPAGSRTLDLLLDVELPVSISFGKTQLPLKDVLKLTTGSIVELNRGINEPVEVLVNHCLVARGEVVVVDGNYGIRIQHIISRLDRLRSVR